MFIMIDCITYRTDGSVFIGERMIGEGNREAMIEDYVSIVIQVANESHGEGYVYYYVNAEIQPICFRDIPSVLYFSISLSSNSSLQFMSHDIYHGIQLKPDGNELSYYEYRVLDERPFDGNETLPLSSSTLSSPISSSPAQSSQRFNYSSLSFLLTEVDHGQDSHTTVSSTDCYSVLSYNIPSGLCGIGNAILHHIIHECSDPQDVIAFLVSSSRIAKVMLNKEYGWSVSYCSSSTLSLRDISCEKVDLV